MADEPKSAPTGDGTTASAAPMEGVTTAAQEATAPPPSTSGPADATAEAIKQKEKSLFGSDDEDEDAALLNKPYGGADAKKADAKDDASGDKKDDSSSSSSSSKASANGAANGAERAEASGGEEAPASPQADAGEEQQAERPVARRRREIQYGAAEELLYWDQPEPPKDAALQFVKLPSYCQISTRPYSRESVEDEEGALETVIRFRKVKNEHGEERIESNARMVRWSDGSTSLLIGDGEALQVSSQDVSRDQNFMYSLHPGFVLRCHSKITTKLKIVAPAGTKAHQQLSQNLQQVHRKEEHKKQAKIFAPTLDPEKDSEQRIKEEQDRIRSQRKLENKKASKQDKMMRSGRLTANFLEGDEGEDEGNIGRLRDRFKRGEDIRRGGSDSEEEAEADFDEEEEEEELEEAEAERRILAAKSSEPARKRGRTDEEEDLVLADDKRAEKKAESRAAPAAAESAAVPAERKRKGHVLEDENSS